METSGNGEGHGRAIVEEGTRKVCTNIYIRVGEMALWLKGFPYK